MRYTVSYNSNLFGIAPNISKKLFLGRLGYNRDNGRPLLRKPIPKEKENRLLDPAQPFQHNAIVDGEKRLAFVKKARQVVNIAGDVINVGLLARRFQCVVEPRQKTPTLKLRDGNRVVNARR